MKKNENKNEKKSCSKEWKSPLFTKNQSVSWNIWNFSEKSLSESSLLFSLFPKINLKYMELRYKLLAAQKKKFFNIYRNKKTGKCWSTWFLNMPLTTEWFENLFSNCENFIQSTFNTQYTCILLYWAIYKSVGFIGPISSILV